MATLWRSTTTRSPILAFGLESSLESLAIRYSTRLAGPLSMSISGHCDRTRINPLRVLAGGGLSAASACSDRTHPWNAPQAIDASTRRPCNSAFAYHGEIDAFAV